MLIFRQLFDAHSSTYTYLLADGTSREAILIDSVYGQTERDLRLLDELDLKLGWVLETHVHADHVTGASVLKKHTDSAIALSQRSGAQNADRYLNTGDTITFGTRHLEARETPGHTSGCITYVLDNKHMAFTGDCLMIRGCGRTDFQQGDPYVLYRSVHQEIFTLPENCLLYPGHDYRGFTVSTVIEEKTSNPRLGNQRSESEFVDIMNNLNLAYPKLIDSAMPANLKLGD